MRATVTVYPRLVQCPVEYIDRGCILVLDMLRVERSSKLWMKERRRLRATAVVYPKLVECPVE